MSGWPRRLVLAVPLSVPVASRAAAQATAAATSPAESFEAASRAILGGRVPLETGVLLDIPPVSENGNSVELSVKVESPTTPEDHVTAIHILSEKNPYPRVAAFTLTPRAGRAEVATRIRLSTSQVVLVLAETSRGVVHRASREVIVVLGACVDGG